MSDYSNLFHEQIATQLATGKISHTRASELRGYADACARLNTVLPEPGTTINLFGYGHVKPKLIEATDVWISLADLVEPTGCDYTALHREWEQLQASDTTAGIHITDPDGHAWTVPLLNMWGIVRVFTTISPWASEAGNSLLPVLRRAAAHSGLAERIEVHDSDGHPKTLGDLIREQPPLASYEVARHQAFTGPTAALDRGEAEQ